VYGGPLTDAKSRAWAETTLGAKLLAQLFEKVTLRTLCRIGDEKTQAFRTLCRIGDEKTQAFRTLCQIGDEKTRDLEVFTGLAARDFAIDLASSLRLHKRIALIVRFLSLSESNLNLGATVFEVKLQRNKSGS
jgi:hypothetical protein